MSADITCLMVAFNAGATIYRAIDSALSQVDQMILVDDGSGDNTVEVAARAGGKRIQVIRFDCNRGIGAARQAAVNACQTGVACWLDADDIWLPGRIEKLFPFIQSGADYVFDESQLVDYCSNRNCLHKKTTDLRFPDFIRQKDGLLHQFGRNYLPTIGVPMARLSALKETGYNPDLKQAEDNEHLLKAIYRNKSVQLSPGISYREYGRDDSTSRNLEKQNACLALSCRFIDQSELIKRVVESSLPRLEQFVILSLFLVRVRNWKGLLNLVASFSFYEQEGDSRTTWMRCFFAGVAEYQVGNIAGASALFEKALSIEESAELYNNLGVCLERAGNDGSALFQQALGLKSGYLDARRNAEKNGQHLTAVPLRKLAYRGEYSFR